jgi:uncharacterized protein (TIGR02246 family)
VRPARRRYFRGRGNHARRLAASLVAAAASPTVSAEPPSWAGSPETAQNEIRSALEEWRTAFNSRDQERVCDLFAPDLIANYQGQPERNYTSLCQLLHMSLQDPERTYRYSLRIDEILVYGEAAVARLVWTLEIEKPDAPKEIIEEPGVEIFRHQADRNWKISRYLAYPASP